MSAEVPSEVTVRLINESALKPGPFKKLYESLNQQIGMDYNNSPWVKGGLAPKCNLVTGPVDTKWTLAIVPSGNGELGEGWHEEAPDGSIKGFVNYAATHWTPGMTSMIASHELLELLVDPSETRAYTDPTTGDTWRVEVCDPVVDSSYTVLGQQVANFVEPQWYGIYDGLFFSYYDNLKTLSAPHTFGLNGYAEVQRASEPGVWTQVTA